MAAETTAAEPQAAAGSAGSERGRLTRYTVVAVLARLADEGARVALSLLALGRHTGTAYAGLLVAALMVPHVVAAPFVGALADRVRRRRLCYVAALLGYAAALASCALLLGTAPRMLILAIVALAGSCAPLLLGGLTSLLRDLAPTRLQQAYGLDAALYGLAGIVGPGLAGILAAVVNPATAVYALAGAVVAASVVLSTLPIHSRRAGDDGDGDDGDGTASAGVLAAVPVMWRSRSLGAVTVASSVAQVGAGGLPLIAALMASGYGSTVWAGVFLSTFAVGSLIGSTLYARFPITAWRPERLVLGGLLISALPFALVPLMPSPGLCLPWLALAGVINGPLFASLFVVRDREAPAHVHTQIFTLGAGLKGTAAAGGAALTGLYAGLGTGPLLLGVAGSYALAAAIGALILRGSPRSATAATR